MVYSSGTYLKALQSPHIHHVIAAFWNKAHHFYSFLFKKKRGGYEEYQ